MKIKKAVLETVVNRKMSKMGSELKTTTNKQTKKKHPQWMRKETSPVINNVQE